MWRKMTGGPGYLPITPVPDLLHPAGCGLWCVDAAPATADVNLPLCLVKIGDRATRRQRNEV